MQKRFEQRHWEFVSNLYGRHSLLIINLIFTKEQIHDFNIMIFLEFRSKFTPCNFSSPCTFRYFLKYEQHEISLENIKWFLCICYKERLTGNNYYDSFVRNFVLLYSCKYRFLIVVSIKNV